MLRVNEKENVPDLGTKALSKAAIMKHSVTQGDVNMTEEKVEVVQQNVATFWDFGSRHHSANAEKSGTCHQHLSQTHQRVGSRCARRQRSTCLSACGIVVPLCSHHQVFFRTCVSQRKHTNAHALFQVSTKQCHPMFTTCTHTFSLSLSLSLLTEFFITGLSPIFLSYLGHFPGRLFLGLRQGQLSRFGRMNKDTKCSDTVLTARELVPGALVL